ncbi:MAG: gliding motility-associated C-terminal domain-containing protein, partial [Cyclobacteriaceae bacterium]|nr:gliding motility-associated C-terminal domain-containing protein [Cyclobacteriaceae bacterium]
SQIFTLSIINVNDTPRFVSTPTLKVLETQKYEYLIEVLDPDPNDNLNVQVVLPPELDWLVLSSEAPYVLQGFPQIGDEGSYEIKLFVIDREGLVDEQIFTIIVKAENNPPTITDDLKIDLEENQDYKFKLDDFKNLFDDIDSNDSLVYIIITGLADHGRLTLGSDLVNENDIIFSNEIDQLIFTPDRNYSGLNFFTWKASDGKASSLSESRVEITTNSLDNPPEIINLESNSINYEFGDFYAQITETAEVVEYDGEEIVSARFTISSNYNDKQDFLSIDEFDGITSDWNDTTGVLSVSGPKSTEVYQQVLRSLIYTNQKRFTPSTNPRTIELLVFDGEWESIPVYREIDFEDTFIELEIPTGFTPNQDDVNDTWEIEYIDSHEDALVRIYSREGIRVYESIGNYKEWDGVYNGSVSKPGVYYYTIEIIKFEKKYSGSVTFLR